MSSVLSKVKHGLHVSIYCYRFDAVNPSSPPQHWQNPEVSISHRSRFEPETDRSILIIKEHTRYMHDFLPCPPSDKETFLFKTFIQIFYIFLSWKSLQINQFIFLCPTKFFERDSIQSVISHVFSQALTSKSLNHHRVANSSRVVATQCDIDIFLSTDLGKIDIYQRHFRGNYYYCQHYFSPKGWGVRWTFCVTRVLRAGAAARGQRPVQVQAELTTKFRESSHNIRIRAFSLFIPRIYYYYEQAF